MGDNPMERRFNEDDKINVEDVWKEQDGREGQIRDTEYMKSTAKSPVSSHWPTEVPTVLHHLTQHNHKIATNSSNILH